MHNAPNVSAVDSHERLIEALKKKTYAEVVAFMSTQEFADAWAATDLRDPEIQIDEWFDEQLKPLGWTINEYRQNLRKYRRGQP